MRPNIHPDYQPLEVTCSCGHQFVTRSALKSKTLRVEVCDQCHPFFTGKHKVVDKGGRIEQFNRRYGAAKNKNAQPSKES